jgi:hypothetical protein
MDAEIRAVFLSPDAYMALCADAKRYHHLKETYAHFHHEEADGKRRWYINTPYLTFQAYHTLDEAIDADMDHP